LAALVISSMPKGRGNLKRWVKSFCDGDALFESFRLSVADVIFVFFVGLHLPFVERVGLPGRRW